MGQNLYNISVTMMFKMRWLLLAFLPVSNACWFYSKESALDKIKLRLGDRTYIDRDYIHMLEKSLPKAVTWAIEKIGVEAAFEDCDANRDGKITLDEMRDTDTCLTSCTKLAVLNTVL